MAMVTGVSEQPRSGTCEKDFDLYSAPGHLIRRAQQVHTVVWTSVVGEDLTSPQFAVLKVLCDHPGIDQTTLSQWASLDTSTCQDIVARLRQRGLIERKRDPGDGRKWLLQMSDEGRATLEAVIPKVREVGCRLLEVFSAQDQIQFHRLLLAIAQRDGSDAK